MDWVSLITPGVISALISGIVSVTAAIVSYHANKKKTESEIKKMKMEWERQDKIREEDNRRTDQLREEEMRRADSEQFQKAVSEMLSSLSKFGSIPDRNTHQDALSAIEKASAIADSTSAALLDQLRESIEDEDPFDGLSDTSRGLLQQIRVQLRK